ncbi:hypothetical protein [Ornithinimicrobium avium]|nr:hypothetical protein [Ornithinimicrobium avium]
MRPKQLAVVGTICLLSGIAGLGLRASAPGMDEPSIWYPLWTAAVFILGVVGAGLLIIGLSFRPEGPAPAPRPRRRPALARGRG